jgi:deoxyribose-phosphate aldolase
MTQDWQALVQAKIAEVLAGDQIIPRPSVSITSPNEAFAETVDHTLLKPDATVAQIDQLCEEALKYNFKVCFYMLFELID